MENTAEATFDFYVCALDLRESNGSAIGTSSPRDFDLTYSHGWQQGLQAIGIHLKIRSR